MVRASAGREPVIDELNSLYEEVIGEFEESGNGEKLLEDRAVAGYLRQLRIDFAANANAASRLPKRVESVPLLGKIGVKLARALARQRKPAAHWPACERLVTMKLATIHLQ